MVIRNKLTRPARSIGQRLRLKPFVTLYVLLKILILLNYAFV